MTFSLAHTQAVKKLFLIHKEHCVTTVTPKKIMLEGESKEQTSLFWSADPAEWSPIASPSTKLAHPIPFTVDDYLQQHASHPALKAGLQETSGVHQLKMLTLTKAKKTTQATTTGHWLHRWLPAIIIILLLVGLAGALLSSFLFPTG